MSNLHLRNIDSDIAAGSLWSYQLDKNSGPEQVVEFTIPGNSTLIGYGFSGAVGAGAEPKTTSLVNFEVVQGSGDITFNLELHRVSSTGSVLQLGGTSGSMTLWPGWWATNFTNLDFGSWGATDRWRVSYRFVNNSSQGRTVSLLMNGESSRAGIPWVPVHRWGGAGVYRRFRARVGRYGGPLAIATNPNTYAGQTEWNMAPLFYSNNVGLSWQVARSTNTSNNDAQVAQYWTDMPDLRQRDTAPLPEGWDETVRLGPVGYDPRIAPPNGGVFGRSPNSFNWSSSRVVGEDYYINDTLNYRTYASFLSHENGRSFAGQHGLYYNEEFGLELGSTRVGFSTAYGMAPDRQVTLLSGGTSYLTRDDPTQLGLGEFVERTRSGPQWNCVTYSPELEIFVIGAADGSIWTSTNGTTWTSRTPPPNAATNSRTRVYWLPSKTFRAGAAGRDVTEVRPGRFVMFGSSSIILSEDGVNWFTPRFAPSRSYKGLAYSRELDVLWAGGSSGYTAISIDFGTSWHEWGRVPQQIDDPYLGGTVFKVHPQSGIHVSGMGWMSDSSQFFVKTGPKPPDLELVARTQTSIQLAWNEITGATYNLRRSSVTNVGQYTWTTVLSDSAALTFDDAGLTGGTLYAYSIQANTIEGDGEWSEAFLASTELTPNAPAAVPALYLIRPPAKRLLWNYISGVNPPAQQLPAIAALEAYGYEVDTVTDAEFLDLGLAGGSPGGALVQYDGIIIRTANHGTLPNLSDYSSHPHQAANEGTGWVGINGLANLVRMMSMSRRTSRSLGLASNSFPVMGNTVQRADGSPVGGRFGKELVVLGPGLSQANNHQGEARMHRMGLGLESSPEFVVEGTTVRAAPPTDPPYTPAISPAYEQAGGVIVVYPSLALGAISPFPFARAHYGIYQSDLWTSVGEQLFLHTVEYWLRA